MTTVQRDKIARRKLSLPPLAQGLGNACQIIGYSRQLFYEIRRNFQLYGAEGLIDRLPGPKGPHQRLETIEDRPWANRRSTTDLFTLIRPLSNGPNPGNLPYFHG